MIRILVVDDEQETAWSIGKILEDGLGEDFSIQVLTSGRKAAQYLKEQKVDILLTDINMPGIDGFELLKMAQEGNQETQVIFLTGYQRFDYVYKASQNKGVRFLVKAETEEAIVHCVKDAVQEIQERKYQEKMLEIARRQLESSRYLVQETDNPPDGWLERVCQYIQAHIEDDISVWRTPFISTPPTFPEFFGTLPASHCPPICFRKSWNGQNIICFRQTFPFRKSAAG